jgi:hypothetical protein
MAKRENESNRLKDLIPRMLEENDLQKGMHKMQVREVWEEVMGPGVANYTQDVILKNETLIVKLNSAALRQELEYGKEKIRRMMDDNIKGARIQSIRLL